MDQQDTPPAAPDGFRMFMSPTVGKIAAAIARAQVKMRPAFKDRTVDVRSQKGAYSYNYATFASCMEALRPFGEEGIAIVQPPVPSGGSSVIVPTWLIHESGEWIRGELELPLDQPNIHGVGSAYSYAKRYGLCLTTGLAADDDDDGNAAMGNEAKFAERAPVANGQAAAPAPSAPAAKAPGPKKTAPKAEKAAPVPSVDPKLVEGLTQACETANTFGVLMAVLEEIDKLPGGSAERALVLEGLHCRIEDLCDEAADLKTLGEAAPLIKALGAPVRLKQAYNQALASLKQPEEMT